MLETDPPQNTTISPLTLTFVASGAALVLVGMPFAWIVRDVANGGKSPVFTAFFQLVGFGLLLNVSALRRGRFYCNKSQLGTVLAPILVICVLCLAPATIPMSMDVQQLVYCIFLIAFVVCLFSRPLLTFQYTHRAVAIVGFVATVAMLAYVLSSFDRLADFIVMGRFGGVGEDTANDAPVVITKIGLLTLVGAIIWFRERKDRGLVGRILLLVTVISEVFIILVSRSRTLLIGVLLYVLLIFFNRLYWKKINIANLKIPHFRIEFVFLIFAVFFTIISNFTVIFDVGGKLLDTNIDFILKAVNTVLGTGDAIPNSLSKINSTDYSAVTRQMFLTAALNAFSLLGRGYNSYFVDNPVFGAFVDLGVVGGALYTLVTVIIPLRIVVDLLRSGNLSPYIHFSIALYVLNMPLLFLSITPYNFAHWIFIILFYAIAGRYWSEGAVERESVQRESVKSQ